MKFRERKKSRQILKLTCMTVFSFLLFAGTKQNVFAASQPYGEITTLDVTVGYWGMPEYSKGEVALDDLESACGIQRVVYTWIDNKPSAGTTEAEGIYIRDIMDYFDIDMDSVYYYNFFTLDSATYEASHEQWTNTNLFCNRYSFYTCYQRAYEEFINADREDFDKNTENYFTLSDFYYSEETRGSSYYLDTAWQERMPVEPMLALRAKSIRWEGDYPAASLDFSQLYSENMPTLLYGQTSVSDVGRYMMAQMVYKVHIWFEGYPVITGDVTELRGKVGDTRHINIQVQTPDDYLTQAISQDIQWQSDDESVATVDEYGNVTFVGEGEANISVVYGGRSGYSVGVASSGEGVGDNNDDGGDDGGEEEAGSGTGNGGGANTGDGNGSGNDVGNGNGAAEGDGNGAGNEEVSNAGATNGNASESNAQNDVDTDNRNQKWILDPESADAQTASSDGGGMSGGSGQGVKVYEVSGSQPEEESIIAEEPLQKGMFAGGAICILAGITVEGMYFRNQTGRRKRAC